MADPQLSEIKAPPADPNNVQAKKRFVFNETGNIMLATTDDNSDNIEKSVRDVFAEVSVFFAAMTKAISTTVDPDSKTGQHYSLYNYDALESVIDGSGCFIHVAEEDVSYTINSWGANFSQDLIKALLGLATGTGELAFASAMVASVGKEGLNISGSSNSSSKRVGNVVFVCEYLLGMPIVSAIVVYCDMEKNSQTFNLGPCFSEKSMNEKLIFHKDTYMFVTPNFIASYSGDLDKGMSDPAFLALTANFQKILTRTPTILNVSTTDRIPKDAPEVLKLGQRYRLEGNFFGNQSNSILLGPAPGTATNFDAKIEILDGAGQPAQTKGGKALTVGATSWSDDAIEFSVGLAGTATWDNTTDEPTGTFTIQVTLAKKLNGIIDPTSATAADEINKLTPIKVGAPRSFGITNQ
jgi:hypothetical protein